MRTNNSMRVPSCTKNHFLPVLSRNRNKICTWKRLVQMTITLRSPQSETWNRTFVTFLVPLRSHCLLPLFFVIFVLSCCGTSPFVFFISFHMIRIENSFLMSNGMRYIYEFHVQGECDLLLLEPDRLALHCTREDHLSRCFKQWGEFSLDSSTNQRSSFHEQQPIRRALSISSNQWGELSPESSIDKASSFHKQQPMRWVLSRSSNQSDKLFS